MSKPIETVKDLVGEKVCQLLFNEVDEVQNACTNHICDLIAESDRPQNPHLNEIHVLVNEFLHNLYGDDIDRARRESEWVKFAVEETLKGRI